MAGSDIFVVHKVTVAAGAVEFINAVGRYVSVIEATSGVPIAIGFDDAHPQFIEQGLTVAAREGDQFKKLRVRNDGGAPTTVTLAIGSGDIKDARFTFAGGSLATSDVIPTFYQVGTTQTVNPGGIGAFLGEDPDRDTLLLTTPIWSIGALHIRHLYGAVKGFLLEPGGRFEARCTDKLYCWNPWPEAIEVIFLETHKS